jgi:hypothetical protein
MRKKLSSLLLSLLLLPVLSLAQQRQEPQLKSYAFTHVTIIDASGAPAMPDMTLVVKGERIAALGKSGKIHLPSDAKVIDARGKFLIPGLWDMHVHLGDREIFFPLFLANGVTGVRDMGNSLEDFERLNRWRKEISQGELLAPRIVAASPILDGSKLATLGFIPVTSEAEARKAVIDFKEQGADFIKVLDLLPRDAYFAIAAESKRQKIPFVGHLPLLVTAREASNAGQRSIEHLFGVLEGCSTKEAELNKELYETVTKPDVSDSEVVRRLWFIRPNKYLASYSETKARELFNTFHENGTWQCPTFVLFKGWLESKDNSGDQSLLKYLPRSLTKDWNPKENLFSKNLTVEDWAIVKKVQQKRLALILPMRRAGVEFLAGTDTNGYNPFLFPGFSLHDELVMLVQAGLTPMEALQSATINPARFVGREKELGTIEQGKLADLVLLDANPLVDIRNTQRINKVMIGGRPLDQAALHTMLAEAEATASKR